MENCHLILKWHKKWNLNYILKRFFASWSKMWHPVLTKWEPLYKKKIIKFANFFFHLKKKVGDLCYIDYSEYDYNLF